MNPMLSSGVHRHRYTDRHARMLTHTCYYCYHYNKSSFFNQLQAFQGGMSSCTSSTVGEHTNKNITSGRQAQRPCFLIMSSVSLIDQQMEEKEHIFGFQLLSWSLQNGKDYEENHMGNLSLETIQTQLSFIFLTLKRYSFSVA